ncbi:BrnT family toxin [Methylomagnum sp.]
MEFQWDEQKAEINRRKHGVSFEEAITVFDDTLARIFDDVWHSVDEYRELIIGHTHRRALLVVCFTERENGVIRVISARPATNRERQDYEEHRPH